MRLPSLEGVETDIERVVKLFTSKTQGYERVLADQIHLGATASEIKKALSSWFSSSERKASDCVIVYYAGHGGEEGNFGSHYLFTVDSVAHNLSSTAIETGSLVQCFFESTGNRSANILLILDVCYAGQGGDQLTANLSRNQNVIKGSGFWIISSVDSRTEAADGAFVDALEKVMQNYDWMPSQKEFLNPHDLKDAINDCLKRKCQNKKQAILQAEINVLRARTSAVFVRHPNFKGKSSKSLAINNNLKIQANVSQMEEIEQQLNELKQSEEKDSSHIFPTPQAANLNVDKRESATCVSITTDNVICSQHQQKVDVTSTFLSSLTTQTFYCDVVTVDSQGQETTRSQSQAQFFAEDLGGGMLLEMVFIPGGTFQMGSPESEDSYDDERPQRIVTVKAFLMSKYPITQGQWRVVTTSLLRVNRDLKYTPFDKEDNCRPVEQISWHDAVEFCVRVSEKTGHDYRLPTEAEWEYACRAKTDTPFYFGETITPKLANYDSKYIYRAEASNPSFDQTTKVNCFSANAFGLFGMHGNVWEWCADYWHKSYEDAPTDGSVWLKGGDRDFRILRGGSWRSYPKSCRSASRGRYKASSKSSDIGFRVVYSLE